MNDRLLVGELLLTAISTTHIADNKKNYTVYSEIPIIEDTLKTRRSVSNSSFIWRCHLTRGLASSVNNRPPNMQKMPFFLLYNAAINLNNHN